MQETYTQTLPPTKNLRLERLEEIQRLQLRIKECELSIVSNKQKIKRRIISEETCAERLKDIKLASETYTKILSELEAELGISKNILEKS